MRESEGFLGVVLLFQRLAAWPKFESADKSSVDWL